MQNSWLVPYNAAPFLTSTLTTQGVHQVSRKADNTSNDSFQDSMEGQPRIYLLDTMSGQGSDMRMIHCLCALGVRGTGTISYIHSPTALFTMESQRLEKIITDFPRGFPFPI